jgi:S-adenosyl-L-methionine hydrolase (adenosine-forming)
VKAWYFLVMSPAWGCIAYPAENCIILTDGWPRAIVAVDMTIITILTDFGLKDGYVGVMKGVIWGIAPQVQFADITHQIHPQNVPEGALALGRVAPYFPAGTVHLAVVDPGVGTHRRPIAARLGEQFFVGPDNGLCTALVEQARQSGADMQFIHLDRPKYWLAEISKVFHGRDIFAPAAAYLAAGTPLEELGSSIQDVQLLEFPRPQRLGAGWRGQIILVDNFGNLSANLTRQHLAGISPIKVRIAGRQIDGLVKTFGDARPGDLVALFGEADDLTVSIVNGDAAAALSVGAGEPIEVLPG